MLIHILDTQSRDIRVEAEEADHREIVYEDVLDTIQSDDEEPRHRSVDRNKRSTELIIHLFGSTPDGKSVRVDVEGFRPTLYIRLPSGASAGASTSTNAAIDAIRAYLTTQGIALSILTLKVVQKKPLYGFTGKDLVPFLELTTPSLSVWRQIRTLFLNDQSMPHTKRPLGAPFKRGTSPEVYEANLDPMLRFFHVQAIQPCGWIHIEDGMDRVEDVSAEPWVLSAHYTDVQPAPAALSAPFLLASWDIECYSQTGDFPVANKSWDTIDPCATVEEALARFDAGTLGALRPHKTRAALETRLRAHGVKDLSLYKDLLTIGDPVIQIGTTLTRDAVTLDRHLFVWPSSDPLDGITVHAYPDETSMMNAWFEWMASINPDILIGYNVFGFDERYMWHRAEDLGLVGPNAPVHDLTRLRDTGQQVKCEEKRLSSSALGDNFMYIWTTQGRLQIDLFHYIKRSASLPSYKLDEVTKHYLSGKLIKGTRDGNKLVLELSGATKDLRPGRALCLLEDTGETLTDKMVVEEVTGNRVVVAWPLREDGEVLEDDELPFANRWVVVKDDVSPKDIFRLHRGSAKDRAIVGKYCLQDCDLVIELYRGLEVFNNSMSMANVCCVPIGYIFTRGQGIKAESLMFKACRTRGILIPVLPAPKQGADGDDSYEGAIVLDPVPGFYSQSPIGVADFASLYPSTIESENISHDSLVWVKDYDKAGTLLGIAWSTEGYERYDGLAGYGYTDIEFDLLRPDPADKRLHPEKVKVGTRVCRYAQPLDGSKATLPEIIRGLLAARKAKRKEKAKETDPAKQALLEAEQLAYKLTANSLYGQLGSSTFKVRLQHLAASVTAYGRKQILFAKAVIDRFYGPEAKNPRCVSTVMYGDTDSLFIEFMVKDPETGERLKGREARQAVMDLTAEAGKLVTKALKPPHDFEFDKIFDPMLMFSKKRYAGLMFEENVDDYVFKYMGIALKRRDNAPIVKTIFGSAMRSLLLDRDIETATKGVQTACLNMVQGKVKLGQLTITKSLRADYADPTRIAHKVLADRMAARDPGSAPASGDRIPFVYVRPEAGCVASKLQGDRIETPSWIKEKGLTPDYEFYLGHQLQNPISQMFGLLLADMPGSDKVPWASAPEDPKKRLLWNEEQAAVLLFQKAYHMCSNGTKKAFATKFFGESVITTALVTDRKRLTAADVSAPIVKKAAQTTLNSFMFQSYLVHNMEQTQRQKKAALKKEAEEAKEANEAKESKEAEEPKDTKKPRKSKKPVNEIVTL
jgi:DNA polymerase elongation subunit (family B)